MSKPPQGICTSISLTFIAPSGQEFQNPDAETISSLLLYKGMEYWNAGSGDAALRYQINRNITAEIIIMFREPYGVFVQFTDPATNQEFVLSDAENVNEEVVIQHGGDPWELPRKYFVRREIADQAIRHFMVHGERALDLRWEKF